MIFSRRRLTFIFTLIFTLASCTSAFAFEWPQHEIASDSFFSYFGQLRGGTISSSIVFQDSADVKACDTGNIAVHISDHGDDFGWFESTLGNALIISHADSIMTVYANLEEDSIPQNILDEGSVVTGNFLGTSGNSAWQDGQSSLEFQVLDVKNSTAINPRILMPRIGKELILSANDLTLRDKKNTDHRLVWERYLPAGVYCLYRERQETAVPYRTVVSINGATVESISYDLLTEKNGRLCAAGNDLYPVEALYPSDKKQLLSVVTLSHGRNVLSVTVIDILGLARTVTYNIDVY